MKHVCKKYWKVQLVLSNQSEIESVKGIRYYGDHQAAAAAAAAY